MGVLGCIVAQIEAEKINDSVWRKGQGLNGLNETVHSEMINF